MSRKAIYAGTFDPPTRGHLWMIQEGARLFDTLVVAIGINPEKRCRFSVEDRTAMLKAMTSEMPNVVVTSFGNHYLIDYADAVEAEFILRGIRSAADFDYEGMMRDVNADMNPNITTVFLKPPRELSVVSSSLVKGLVGPNGWEEIVSKYVTPEVLEKLKEKR